MPIVAALLKYGQDNFAVLIVEYVDVKELTILPILGILVKINKAGSKRNRFLV
jgi:hypothetical protein